MWTLCIAVSEAIHTQSPTYTIALCWQLDTACADMPLLLCTVLLYSFFAHYIIRARMCVYRLFALLVPTAPGRMLYQSCVQVTL
jgi:hypothetical protein